MLSVGENGLSDSSGNITLFSASVTYTGEEWSKESLLKMSDQILLSLKKAPKYSDWKEVSHDSISFLLPENWESEISVSEYFGGEVVEVWNPSNTVRITLYPTNVNRFPYGFGGDPDLIIEKPPLEITFLGEKRLLEESIVTYSDHTSAFVDFADGEGYAFLFGTGYPAGSDDRASLSDYMEDRATVIKILESFELSANMIEDNWQSYENDLLGFQVQHPSGVAVKKELNDAQNRLVEFQGDSLHFSVMIREQGENFSLENYYYLDSPVEGESFVSDRPATVYTFPSGYCDGPLCTAPFISIVFTRSSDIFHISFFGDTTLSETESRIMDSFGFMY